MKKENKKEMFDTSIYSTKEQILRRIDWLTKTLKDEMPSIINAIGYGFTPINATLYGGYANELEYLLSTVEVKKIISNK
jgi:hypothetical protein